MKEMDLSSQVINNFSGNLFNILIDDGHTGNSLASPLGLVTMISMILPGCKGRTYEQLVNALNVKSDEITSLHDSFKKVVATLDRGPDQVSKFVETGNLLDKSKPFSGYDLFNRSMAFATDSITEDYMSFLRNFYKAEMEYSAETFDGSAVMEKINNWVKNTTYGRIPTILNEPPSKDVKLILLNSVFFSGKWTHNFRSLGKKTFLNNGLEKVHVDMMVNETTFNYRNYVLYGEEVEILELPYIGSSSMVVILPKNATGINKIFKNKIDKIVERFDNQKVYTKTRLVLPKFKIETTLNVIPTLKSMGVKDLLSKSADLSGMTGTNIGLHVSKMDHKTKIEVDEKGTVAAAVTICFFRSTSLFVPTVDFIVDRPFAFVIRDTASKMILFVGKIAQL